MNLSRRAKELDRARHDANAAGVVFPIHASWCPYSAGGDVCTCVPARPLPGDCRSTLEIVEAVERRHRG